MRDSFATEAVGITWHSKHWSDNKNFQRSLWRARGYCCQWLLDTHRLLWWRHCKAVLCSRWSGNKSDAFCFWRVTTSSRQNCLLGWGNAVGSLHPLLQETERERTSTGHVPAFPDTLLFSIQTPRCTGEETQKTRV